MTDYRDQIIHDRFCRCRVCKPPFDRSHVIRWDRVRVGLALAAVWLCLFSIARAAF